MSVKTDIKFRVYLVFILMLVFGVAIIAKALYIQVKDGEVLLEMAEKKHIRTQQLTAERGKIYSDNGALLSSTIPQFDIRIDFKSIPLDTFNYYLTDLSQGIAAILGGNASEYKRKLNATYHQSSGNRYWLLKKNASYSEYQALRALPIFNKGKYGGGFIPESKVVRQKPYGLLASRTIGIYRENASNVGLEQKYNDFLAGNDGVRVIRRGTGHVWEPVEGTEIEPVNGKDIVSTINVDIQDITQMALKSVLEEFKAQFGTAIVMEVQTGQIKAIANLGLQENGSYAEDLNYALMPSEPGSTFKLMSMLALIDDGYISLEDKIDVEGGLKRFGRQRIVDDSRGLGVITLKEAFAKSSNVAFAKLIDQYYKDRPMKFIKHLQKMKLHQRTGIDLLGEPAPLIKTTDSKSWNAVTSLPWIAYGYESLITPLHTCMVYNAVANDGKLMKPYLVSEIREYGRVLEKFDPVVLEERIAKPSTIKQLQEALHAVVEEGTARSVKSPYYNAGGKTGTAQVADKGITYRDGVRQGSFVGYFPMENPQYTIAILVRSVPHGVYYGSILGGSVFKKIADKLYANEVGGWALPIEEEDRFNIPETKALVQDMDAISQFLGWDFQSNELHQWMSFTHKGQGNQIEGQPINEAARTVLADVSGMSLKDALTILETQGLKVRINGSGKVSQQSLQAGSRIKPGQEIIIYLN